MIIGIIWSDCNIRTFAKGFHNRIFSKDVPITTPFLSSL